MPPVVLAQPKGSSIFLRLRWDRAYPECCVVRPSMAECRAFCATCGVSTICLSSGMRLWTVSPACGAGPRLHRGRALAHQDQAYETLQSRATVPARSGRNSGAWKFFRTDYSGCQAHLPVGGGTQIISGSSQIVGVPRGAGETVDLVPQFGHGCFILLTRSRGSDGVERRIQQVSVPRNGMCRRARIRRGGKP